MSPEQIYEKLITEVVHVWLPDFPQDNIGDIGVICGLYPFINTCNASELHTKTIGHWHKLSSSAECDILELFGAYTDIETWTMPYEEDYELVKQFTRLLEAITHDPDYLVWLKTTYAPRQYLLALKDSDDAPLYCQYYIHPLAPAWEFLITKCFERFLKADWT